MTVMFGIKLDEELDRRISEFARSRGQAKSEVGRRALVEYLDRHAIDQEFKRQLAVLMADDHSDMDELEALAFDNPDWK